MSDNDLIRRSDALNALRLGETITKLQARIAALPTVTDLGKTQRIIAARDRRIARLVSALNDARAKGYVTPAEQEPALVLSAAQPAPSPWRPIETVPQTGMGPWMLLGHSEGKWVRMGWYYAACRKWYYSGTTERTQYSEAEGGVPTHWMPLPPAP